MCAHELNLSSLYVGDDSVAKSTTKKHFLVLMVRNIGRASLGRIFQDSDWLRDGPMRRIGPPWGIFGQESLQIPPAERSPGSTLGLGPLLDIQTFGGRRRRQFEPRYARVEPPPAPTASGPISNIGPRPRADPRSLPLTTHHTRVRQRCDCSRVP